MRGLPAAGADLKVQPLLNPELHQSESLPEAVRQAGRAAAWSPMRWRHRIVAAVTLIALAVLITIPGRGLRNYVARVRLFAVCARELKQISEFSIDTASPYLVKTLQERPTLVGVAAWPYINGQWTTRERFSCLRNHYRELDDLPALQIGTREAKVISDLGDVVPGLRLVIDRPNWFMREGELTINLFTDEFRAYSLAFSVGRAGGERVLFVGCIQGRQADNVDQLYRELTKKLHGWRPRDLMVSLVQMIGSASGARTIRLVSEAARVHRHEYFGHKGESLVSANYDDIWREHQAVPGRGGFFDLGTQLHQREPHEIASNKRAMYRRRYELMDRIQADVAAMMAPRPAGQATWRAAEAPAIQA